MRCKRSMAQGFTLVELLVVITILGILATAVAIGVVQYVDRARRTRARMDVASLVTAMKLYRIHLSEYPTAEEGFKALMEKPSHPDKAKAWQGPYVERIPKDPWGHEYVYVAPGPDSDEFDVRCYGKDGLEGGEGLNADITRSNLDEP